MSRKLTSIACALAIFFAAPVFAQDAGDAAPAGLLAYKNKTNLPEVMLSVGEPLGGPWALKSGQYYEVELTSDGSGEIGLDLSGFSRAIWIDEVVIEGLEIRPFGLDSIEFDQAGTMEIGFVAVKPGSYSIQIPGATGPAQILAITVE